MKTTQKLSNGIIIRQNIKDAIRLLLFETSEIEWKYGTHGGTLFIINYKNNIYGITCGHAKGDFNWSQLVVTNTKFGEGVAGLEAVYSPQKPKKFAVGSDITDIRIIKFSEDSDSSFFKDSAYIIESQTITEAAKGDALFVAGNLKSQTEIEDKTIKPKFCDLGLIDAGPASFDVVLRVAKGQYTFIEFEDIKGISGAPVFNSKRNSLSGMVVRGSLVKNSCTILYIDIMDIVKVLSAAHVGKLEVLYEKIQKKEP